MKVFRLAQLSPPLYSQDLDITKPGGRKPAKRCQLETSTKEILRKADFKNVRFLANFTTEAGAIIRKSKTKISLKAQRKVAREIKTARILVPSPLPLASSSSMARNKLLWVDQLMWWMDQFCKSARLPKRSTITSFFFFFLISGALEVVPYQLPKQERKREDTSKHTNKFQVIERKCN